MIRILTLLTAMIFFSEYLFAQEPFLIPPRLELKPDNCDANSIYKAKLMEMVKSWGYQRNSMFHKDTVTSIDLNMDGICEYILKYYDGGANIINEFYEVKNNELRKICTFWENTYSFRERFEKYPQILLTYYDGHKTNPIWKFSVLRFNGDNYTAFYSPKITYGEMKDIGLKEFNNGNYNTAEIYFRNVLTVYTGKNTSDMNNLALVLIKQNKLSEAKKILLDDVSSNESPDSYYNLSLIFKKENDINNELKYLTESNRLKPSTLKEERIKEIKNSR